MNLKSLQTNALILVFSLLFFGGLSCKTTRKKTDFTPLVKNLIPQSLRVRRPEGEAADPKVGPGGIDYRSHPLPNEQLDCEKVSWLYKQIDLHQLRNCISSLKETAQLQYRLGRAHPPELELEDPEDAPKCMRELLLKIPVPREIVFRSKRKIETEEGSLEQILCYSARLNVEANRVLGARLPTDRVSLVIDLPLDILPEDDDAMIRLLASWSLTPLWNSRTEAWDSKIMPDHLCKLCLGLKDPKFQVQDDDDDNGVTW